MYIKVLYQRRIDDKYSVIADENAGGFKSGQVIDIVKFTPPGNEYLITKGHAESTLLFYPAIGRCTIYELLDKFPPKSRRRGTGIKNTYTLGTGARIKQKEIIKYQFVLSDGNSVTVSKTIFDLYNELEIEHFKFRT